MAEKKRKKDPRLVKIKRQENMAKARAAKKKKKIDEYAQKVREELERFKALKEKEELPENSPAAKENALKRQGLKATKGRKLVPKSTFDPDKKQKQFRFGLTRRKDSVCYKSPGTSRVEGGPGFNRISKKHFEALKVGHPTCKPPTKAQILRRSTEEKLGRAPHAFQFEVQERLLWVAAQIRNMVPLQEIKYNFCKRFGVGEKQAQKYIRDVYEEHKGMISEEDRALIFFEFRETLREAIRRSMSDGKMVSVEKLMRLLGEVEGIVTPKGLVNVDARKQIVSHVQVQDGGIAELTLSKLDNLLEQESDERSGNSKVAKGLPALPQSSVAGSEEADLVSQPPSHDNQGQES